MRNAVSPTGPCHVSVRIPLVAETMVIDDHGNSVAWDHEHVANVPGQFLLGRCHRLTDKPPCDGSNPPPRFDRTELRGKWAASVCNSPRRSPRLTVSLQVVVRRKVAGDNAGDVSQRIELLRTQQIDETVPHRVQMNRGCGFDGFTSGSGQDDVESPSVALAGCPLDCAAGLHARDLVRQPAALPAERPSEITRPDPVSGRLGDDDKNGVLGLAEIAVTAELSGKVGREVGAHLVEAPPRPRLPLIQPLWLHQITLVPQMLT